MSETQTNDLIDYLAHVRQIGGSDLHITVGSPPLARIHGSLTPINEVVLDGDLTRDLIMEVLTEKQRASLEADWELDFAVQVEQVGRFRGNVHYAQGNLEAAFRYIPAEIPALESLGHSHVVGELCRREQGLILVTGIAGSGKSTTLAAMATKILQERPAVMVSIEDPIEFVFQHAMGMVKQRELGSDTKTFPEALRRAMRQDPDVIIVSEMRDLETIQTAITAAETGHLVISTLHTIDAPNTVDRLVDVFPAGQQQQIATQLASCLIGVVSQRLLVRDGDDSGRVLATEVMMVNHAISACIRDRKLQQILGLLEIGANDGMHTMDSSLAYLAGTKAISLQQALTYARDKEFVTEEFKVHLKSKGKSKKRFWGKNK